MESAAPCPRAHAHPVDLRWLLSVAAGGLFALLLVLLATSPSFRLASTSPSPRLFLGPASGSSRARPPLFVEPALSRPAAPSPPASASLPRFAYLISGSAGDAGMMRRCLLALYHPRNRYVLHLDAEAPDADRAGLAAFVAAHPVLAAARNVRVVEKANLVTYRGPTMVTTTLHAAAALLWGEGRGRGADWDWFINLSASDYPLMTQDDILHVFSTVPRNVNFIEHTGYLGWKEGQRARPLIVDPGLYGSKKQDIFWVSQKRELPTAFKLFTGSAWVALTRDFVEYTVWGWDNLPRTLLMYYANFVSSPEGYFQTLLCNAPRFVPTVANHDLHHIQWDVPPRQHPHPLALADMPAMLASGAPFARKFPRDDPVLDAIDDGLLARPRTANATAAFVPGGWCGADAECRAVDNDWVLRPGPGAQRFRRLIDRIVRSEAFPNRQCK